MENTEEINKSEIVKREIEEHKIEAFEDDTRPISYTYKQRIAREKVYEVRIEKAQKIFFDYLKFYNENYPESTHDIEWSDKKFSLNINKTLDFEVILDKLSEEELYRVHNILAYSKKESFSGSMKEYNDYLDVDAMITKRIPGWNILQKIEKLKEKQQKDIREIEKLKRLYIDEKKEFLLKKEVTEEIQKEQKKEFLCELCGKACTNKAGLTSHMRGHKNGNGTKNNISYKSGTLTQE